LFFFFMPGIVIHGMKDDSKNSLTSMVTRLDLVVLTVHILGGDSRAVDTEDVGIKIHELAPGMFAWRKYPEQINLELVRVTLSDAKKSKYGALLTGSGRAGWRLSPAGISWVASHGHKLAEGSLCWDSARRTAGSVDTVRKAQELKRLKGSEAWRKWSEDVTVSLAEAHWLFRIDSFTSEAQKTRKIVRIMSLFADDKEVSEFLSYASDVLGQGTGGPND